MPLARFNKVGSGGILLIPVERIAYLHAWKQDDRTVHLHLTTGEVIAVEGTMADVERHLVKVAA